MSFTGEAVNVPPRRGFALRDAIHQCQYFGSTNTDTALCHANGLGYDRIIVITDEQSHQRIRGPLSNTRAYFINVATYQNGIGYGAWTHIDGFSEAVVDYIREFERASLLD